MLKLVVGIAQILKTACVIAIVLIVTLQLSNYQFTLTTTQQSFDYVCLLGSNNGRSLCTYAYIGAEPENIIQPSHVPVCVVFPPFCPPI